MYAAQGAHVLPLANYLTTVEQLVPGYFVMVLVFVALSAAGLVVDAAALLRGRQLARCAATASSVLVFVGIFVMRFAFYMMHMTYGMSL